MHSRLRAILATALCISICATAPLALSHGEGWTCSHALFPPQLKDGAFPRHYRHDRTVDFERLKLEIQVFMSEQRVEGAAHYTLKPIHDDVRFIRLEAVEMEIENVQLEETPFTWEHLDNQIFIHLDEPLPLESETLLTVRYKAAPQEGMYFSDPDRIPPRNPDQMYTLGETLGASLWFPSVDYPSDRMQTELVATVPRQFVTLSNGLKIDSYEHGDWRTDHWKQEIPHVTYLVSLVVGDFDIISESWRGIPVDYYVEAGRADDAIPSLGKTPAMLEFFSEWLGVDYPYRKYAQSMVRYFLAGGMEHTTATTMFEWLTIDDEARLDYEYDDLISHELIHQWFGDLVTCEKWDHLWLNESFATYLECVWRRYESGEDYYLVKLLDDMNSYLRESRRYQRAIVTNRFANPREMFDGHSYPKGGFVLSMLHRQLGEDLFRAALKHYLDKHHNGLVDTDDLMEAVETVSGKPMDRFFEQWVYSPGHPVLEVSHEWLPAQKQLKLEIKQTQDMDEGRQPFAFPLDVRVETAEGLIETSLDINSFSESAFIDCPAPPQSIAIDPQLKVLMELKHKKSTDMLLHELQQGATAIVKIRAIDALRDHKQDRVAEALAECVRSEIFRRVRMAAADALGSIQTDAARHALLDLADIAEPHVRRSVIAALGRFYQDTAVEQTLIDTLNSDPSIRVIATAANSLARIEASDAQDALRRLVDRDSFRNVIRRSVIDALIELGDKTLYTNLKRYCGDPYHRDVRTHALGALGRWAYEADMRKDDALEVLISNLFIQAPRIQEAAIRGLESLRHEDAIPHLQRFAEAGPEHGGKYHYLRERARNAIDAIRAGQDDKAAENASRIDKLENEKETLTERIESLEQSLERLIELNQTDMDESPN